MFRFFSFLKKLKVGFADIEEFYLGLNHKCQAKSDQEGQIVWKIIKAAMESNLIDARKTDKSLKCEQNIIRKRIYGKNGDASRKSKKTIRAIRGQNEQDKLDEIPKGMDDLEELSICNRNKFKDVETQ